MPTRDPKASILIVDDTVENLQVLTSMLHEQGYEARPVPNGRLALQAVQMDPPDLILLDINMPVLNGFQVCSELKARDETRDIPVIFISALSEIGDKVAAFAAGGCDYLTKPFELQEVSARVECHLALRRTRKELERSYANLSELEQLRDSLVHMIVHDMRSPIHVLLANAEILKLELADRISAEHMEDIHGLWVAGEQLRQMADTLLDVSRLEAGRMPLELRECDLTRMVRRTTERLRVLDTTRPLLVDAPGAVPIVCDERLVDRVVENLVSNGVKHTPAGRPIRVFVTQQPAEVRVRVCDEGEGVPEALRARIFEKFGAARASGEQRYHSAGLGLALCKLAVEAHGGTIGVDSNPGQGSAFWFILPQAGTPRPA